MWGAVVVVGSVASFEIWLRALDPGQELPAVAPRGVEATSEKTVPAIISLRPAATPSHRGGGSHPGELCANDRAIIFEDPTGVRFLYDAAQNVTQRRDGDFCSFDRLSLIVLIALATHIAPT